MDEGAKLLAAYEKAARELDEAHYEEYGHLGFRHMRTHAARKVIAAQKRLDVAAKALHNYAMRQSLAA